MSLRTLSGGRRVAADGIRKVSDMLDSGGYGTHWLRIYADDVESGRVG